MRQTGSKGAFLHLHPKLTPKPHLGPEITIRKNHTWSQTRWGPESWKTPKNQTRKISTLMISHKKYNINWLYLDHLHPCCHRGCRHHWVESDVVQVLLSQARHCSGYRWSWTHLALLLSGALLWDTRKGSAWAPHGAGGWVFGHAWTTTRWGRSLGRGVTRGDWRVDILYLMLISIVGLYWDSWWTEFTPVQILEATRGWK